MKEPLLQSGVLENIPELCLLSSPVEEIRPLCFSDEDSGTDDIDELPVYKAQPRLFPVSPLSGLICRDWLSKTIIHFRNGPKYYWNTLYPEAKKESSDILNLIPNNNYANEYLQMIAKS
jgi:hypothetical protein